MIATPLPLILFAHGSIDFCIFSVNDRIFFFFEFGLRIRRLPPGTYFVRTPRGLPGRGTSEAKPSHSELGVVMNLAVPPLAPCQEAHLPMPDTPNRPFC